MWEEKLQIILKETKNEKRTTGEVKRKREHDFGAKVKRSNRHSKNRASEYKSLDKIQNIRINWATKPPGYLLNKQSKKEMKSKGNMWGNEILGGMKAQALLG